MISKDDRATENHRFAAATGEKSSWRWSGWSNYDKMLRYSCALWHKYIWSRVSQEAQLVPRTPLNHHNKLWTLKALSKRSYLLRKNFLHSLGFYFQRDWNSGSWPYADISGLLVFGAAQKLHIDHVLIVFASIGHSFPWRWTQWMHRQFNTESNLILYTTGWPENNQPNCSSLSVQPNSPCTMPLSIEFSSR